MTLGKIVSAILVIVVVCIVVGALLVWKPQIDPVETENASAFNSGLVAKGAELAAIGNCADCHTAPGGKSYAGSRALPTPFGTIYTSNITPDSETGIGNWSEEAFRRALRDGVDREGRHLYPAFPYDHFTHLTDDDIHALYAFIITRESVRSVPPTNKLSFPYNIRSLLSGWKLLFLQRGPRNDDGTNSAEWNRGLYLVESAAHCGACIFLLCPRLIFARSRLISRVCQAAGRASLNHPSGRTRPPLPRRFTRGPAVSATTSQRVRPRRVCPCFELVTAGSATAQHDQHYLARHRAPAGRARPIYAGF
jgi:mono/diheme cytochrome c family protein